MFNNLNYILDDNLFIYMYVYINIYIYIYIYIKQF